MRGWPPRLASAGCRRKRALLRGEHEDRGSVGLPAHVAKRERHHKGQRCAVWSATRKPGYATLCGVEVPVGFPGQVERSGPLLVHLQQPRVRSRAAALRGRVAETRDEQARPPIVGPLWPRLAYRRPGGGPAGEAARHADDDRRALHRQRVFSCFRAPRQVGPHGGRGCSCRLRSGGLCTREQEECGLGGLFPQVRPAPHTDCATHGQ
mmetsp:Transcript_119094/g.297144  ORF Transcript_119094/g.297144 Transcript_119094/m.297144 type:complete len:208 (-) Transcript_119094:1293-1916(-)